jgi:hypothetical protein
VRALRRYQDPNRILESERRKLVFCPKECPREMVLLRERGSNYIVTAEASWMSPRENVDLKRQLNVTRDSVTTQVKT